MKMVGGVLAVVCVLFVGCRLSTGQTEGCSSGFLSDQAEIEAIMMIDGAVTQPSDNSLDRRQWIMPSINFTCNGSVTKWIVGAEWDNNGNNNSRPELQIWRLMDSTRPNTYSKMESTLLRVNEDVDEVYEVSLTDPLEFQSGDILGIYQPQSPLNVYFVTSRGPINYYQGNQNSPLESFTIADDISTQALPLVAVVVSVLPTSSQNLQSTPGGSSPESSSTSGREGITSIPTTITMAATPLPPSPTVTVASSMSTSAAASSMLSGESSTSIQVPGSTLLSGSSDVPYTTETSVQMPSMTPTLTTVKLSSSTAIPSPTQDETSSKPAPTTPKPTRPVGDGVGERSSGDSSGGLIAGVVIAVVVIILIVLGIIILAVFILRRRKRAVVKVNSYDNPMECMDNPVYTGDIPGHYIYGGATVATNGTTTILKAPDVLYEDATSCGVYQTIEDTQQQHEATLRSESHYESQGARRNIYSCISDETAPPPSRGASLYEEPVQKSQSICQGGIASHYEWGIHVPTQDQRKLIDFGASGSDSAQECEVHENIYASLAETQQCSSFFEECGTYWRPSSEPSELYEQLATKKYREIPRNQIQITAHLGAGQFGTVNKGVWQSRAGAKDVAVKMLKEGSAEEEKIKLLQESAINGQFRHINVVRLLGVVTLDEPVMIVLELLENGDLRNYLIKLRPVPGKFVPSDTPKTFLRFCQQIASGMEYLSRKGFVHRDMAARNILVSVDKTCKIGDFGMSRDLVDENYYISHGGKVPVKWTAPEALHYKKYTSASDVWSYGALMYEMWSLGHKPFEGYTNAQTIKLIDSKYRLPPPPGCPKEVYKIMIHCWHPDRSSRPTFTQLSEALSEPETELLVWSEEDANIHTHAMILGAALDAGKDLYPDLQKIYM